MRRPISRKAGGGIEESRDALARGHLAGAVLLFYTRRSAAFPQAIFQFMELLHQEPQMGSARQPGRSFGCLHDGFYFSFEKSVGSMKTESTWLTIFPLASEAAATFFHSGSLLNSFQCCAAASRLGWARM